MTTNKINNAELLNESELDKVAGGYDEETYEDIDCLKETCRIDCGRGYDPATSVHLLRQNYANAGVAFAHHDDRPNEYFDINTGRKLSHRQAMDAFVRCGRNLHR